MINPKKKHKKSMIQTTKNHKKSMIRIEASLNNLTLPDGSESRGYEPLMHLLQRQVLAHQPL